MLKDGSKAGAVDLKEDIVIEVEEKSEEINIFMKKEEKIKTPEAKKEIVLEGAFAAFAARMAARNQPKKEEAPVDPAEYESEEDSDSD